MAGDGTTLVEQLCRRAAEQPDRRAYTFLQYSGDGAASETTLTYGEIDRQARSIAAQLRPMIQIGERALLVHPPGLEFISAFFGCLYAGVLPAVASPPHGQWSESPLGRIAADCNARLLLTTQKAIDTVDGSIWELVGLGHLPLAASDELAAEDGGETFQPVAPRTDDIAYLQYTSGSTDWARGVMVSHANVIANHACIRAAYDLSPQSVVVNWSPSYHDMGLNFGFLQPLVTGFHSVQLGAADFVSRPLNCLEAISRFRADHAGGPNVAFEIFAARTTKEERATLDLSCWKHAFNGAMDVQAGTLERFTETFAACGFRAEFHRPGFGLAEVTLLVTSTASGQVPVTFRAASAALEEHRVEPAAAGDEGRLVRTLVGCGRPLLDTSVRIVDPQTRRPTAHDRVGEIWVAGPSVALGYWGRPQETEETFRAFLSGGGEGPFLRTGDLGFIRDDELFITGRIKDTVYINQLFHYPQHIEQSVEKSHPALRRNAGAAFVDWEPETRTVRLVIANEVERTRRRDLDVEAVASAVCTAVWAGHGLEVHELLLLRPGSIPKTTSGKIRRGKCQEQFQSGNLRILKHWKRTANDEAPEAPSKAELE